MDPLAPNPPPQPARQPGESVIEAQLDHNLPPAGPESAPPAPPPKPARWGVIAGRVAVLLLKVVAYAAFSPFILCYAAGYIISGYVISSDFSVKEGMGDLFKPLSKELRNIYLGYMGYTSKRDYITEMRKAQFEAEKQRKAAEDARAQPQPPAQVQPPPPPPPENPVL